MSLGHVGHVKSGHYGLTTLEERDTKMRKLLSVMFLAVCLIGNANQEAEAQNSDSTNEPKQVEIDASVVSKDDDHCAEGKPRTKIEVDALPDVEYKVKNVKDDCVEITAHTYNNGKSAGDGVPADETVDPFHHTEKVVEKSGYDFGGGFFLSGLLLPQRSSDDLHSSANESLEEMFTAGLVGTLNTPSWEWSANIGAGGCGKREVAGTAGVALLNKMSSEHFRLGGTVNVDVCSNVTDPGEELVQLRTFDAGLRLAGSWKNVGVYVDFVGAVSTKPLFIGRSTEFGGGVRAGVIVGKF